MTVTMLRVALVQSDLRQRDVAAHIGVHEVTLSRIVNGRRPASVGVQRCLAATVGRPVDELFDREGRPLVLR